MSTPAFNFYNAFSEALAEKLINLDTDTINVYLSNTAPNAATMVVKNDQAEISTGNGYTGPLDTQNATSRTGAVTSVTGVNCTWTSSGAGFTARYVILHDATANILIGWWDHGSSDTAAGGNEWKVKFGASMFVVTP